MLQKLFRKLEGLTSGTEAVSLELLRTEDCTSVIAQSIEEAAAPTAPQKRPSGY